MNKYNTYIAIRDEHDSDDDDDFVETNYIRHRYITHVATGCFMIGIILLFTSIAMNPDYKPPTSFAATSDGQKPNFVILLADDLAWNSIGYSSDELAFVTPTLTSLAQSGVIMDNFYAQEVCSPSRGSLLTGRYPLSIGMQYGMVGANAEWGMPLDEITLPEVLADYNYKSHILGKWHLGYFTPLLLPTARGFDTWTGYSNGENYYWSKKSPDYPQHSDFLESTTECYTPYNESDKHTYSTILYTNKAVSIIENHDTSDPLFLFMSYQAVHDPFVDYGNHKSGMPDTYIEDSILEQIDNTIVGKTRQEYAKSLYLLDQSVATIRDTLETQGLLDNTYIIFMSDNGGCMYGGGKNGPLRGSKGALFEGGIKVDSFIYGGPLTVTGTVYKGLMHISDWFPTILALANIDYDPPTENLLDGVNQADAWSNEVGSTDVTPRSYMLYNKYTDLTDYNFNIWTNGSFAVRDARYKLMHTYNDAVYGNWYNAALEIDGDDDLDSDDRCAQQFVTGEFTYWFFDLQTDPYEKINLYSSTNPMHTLAKAHLYSLLDTFSAKTKISIQMSDKAEVVWSSVGNNIVPWADVDNLVNDAGKSYPRLCL